MSVAAGPQPEDVVGHMPRVLIVDDDADIRTTLAEILSAEGFAVTTAVDGKDALARLDEATPDLVLLDIMMPVMNGLEFLEHKRARPVAAAVPVIVATASGHTDVPGAAAVLMKPFGLDVLLDVMSRMRAAA